MLSVVVPSACVVVVGCCAPSVDAVAIVANYFRRVVLVSCCAQWCLLFLTWIVEPGLLVAAPLPCKIPSFLLYTCKHAQLYCFLTGQLSTSCRLCLDPRALQVINCTCIVGILYSRYHRIYCILYTIVLNTSINMNHMKPNT